MENKSLYKKINKAFLHSYDIIQWNKKFTILGTELYICIFNNEDYSLQKKIECQAKDIKEN